MNALLSFVSIYLLISSQLCDGFQPHRHIGTTISSRLHMSSKYLSKEPVFVAGGTSGLGLEVVRKLSSIGTPVRALVRRDDARECLEKLPGVTVVMGDALDESAVQSAMIGCVAAVSTLGGKLSDPQSVRVDYEGNSNVIEQAGILGVERIILVTSVGCGDTKGALAVPTYQALEKILLAKSRAERDLKMYTNLDWTIIRPGGLRTGQHTGQAILTEDTLASGLVDRADVAEVVVRVLGSDGLCTRRELTVVNPAYTPGYAYKPFLL